MIGGQKRQRTLPLFLAEQTKKKLFWPIIFSLLAHIYLLTVNPVFDALSSRTRMQLPLSNLVVSFEDRKERAEEITNTSSFLVSPDSVVKLKLPSETDFQLAQKQEIQSSDSEILSEDLVNFTKSIPDFKKRPFGAGRSSSESIDYEQKKNIAISGKFFESQNQIIRSSQIYQNAKENFIKEIYQIIGGININDFRCDLSQLTKCTGLEASLTEFISKKWEPIWRMNGSEKISFGMIKGQFFFETTPISR